MNSLWLSHPTGNVFVRALLQALHARQWDYHFFSSLAFSADEPWLNWLPRSVRADLSRRAYELPADRITSRPVRETARLLSQRFGKESFVAGAFSTQSVYESLDRSVARSLERALTPPASIYAYEDGALASFEMAARLGAQRVYDLPILYWETSKRILETEAARWPAWEPTLGATRDSEVKLARKTRELELADIIVCPSRAVFDSLPETVRLGKKCILAPFGSPEPVNRPIRAPGKLRVLFAGQMTQRKGLADLFAAMKLLRRSDVELVVLGAPILPMDFYRRIYPDFVYEAPRNHRAVLEVMASCDLLVLPSLVEGRALVQQEALACGLPLIVTENAGAPDLVEPGQTGFLVPIRSPEAIAERLDGFASHRTELEHMRNACRRKAAQYRWDDYGLLILEAVSGQKPNALAAA